MRNAECAAGVLRCADVCVCACAQLEGVQVAALRRAAGATRTFMSKSTLAKLDKL